MKNTTHLQTIYAKSAQSVAECLSLFLHELDAAQLPKETLEALSVEIHALSVSIDRFKIHAASEFAVRASPSGNEQVTAFHEADYRTSDKNTPQ